MSGNGAGYSEFKAGNVLPNHPVKGTEAGADQMKLFSTKGGARKSKNALKKTMKGGNGSCGAKTEAPLVMNGGKKHRKSKRRTNKRRSFLRFFGL